MLTRLDLRGQTSFTLPRPSGGGDEPVQVVKAIIADVRERGDAAVRELTSRLDGPTLASFVISTDGALDRIPAALRDALELAAANIRAYHETQLVPEVVHERDGIVVRDLHRPVERAGCYVPGGRALYPSTVLMTAIPARVAGVAEVVLCVPPRGDGSVPDEVLAAAAIAGVDTVYAIGGAQAVAAMAYGTESIRPVDVIVGPGNVYVALAKREVAGVVGVPSSFAGPSEVVVVGDGSVRPQLAAIDVVLQAEHGPDGLAWLITWDDAYADLVTAEVARIVESSPRREEITSTLHEGGYAVLVDGPEQAIAVANLIAPEHLELLVEDPDVLLPLVKHAGAVFCGQWSPASVGDYLAGPNHVLPTFGSARFSEALRVDDFIKHVHVVTLDRAALDKVAPHVATLARAEGLVAHAQSVELRTRG